MVVAAGARRGAAAIVVPDEQAWTVWGTDPASLGLEPVLDVGRARRLLLPETVPDALVPALVRCLGDLPLGIRSETRPAVPISGEPLAVIVERAMDELSSAPERNEHDDGHAGEGDEHGGHDDDHAGDGDEHGGHDDDHADDGDEHGGHDDMMSITGEPSADGLVMEPIEFSLGPLTTPLPGGLTADLVLDGDVVAECTVRATLRQPGVGGARVPPPPDLLAPATWSAVIAQEAELHDGVQQPPPARWLRLASVELERAISHLAWLRAFARLLGWASLVADVGTALSPLLAARAALPVELAAPDVPDITARDPADALEQAAAATGRLKAACEDSRRLRSRTDGRGAVAAERAQHAGLSGPSGRASGSAVDARSADALYRELGFTPVVRDEGDAYARALLRLDESASAIGLASAALERATGNAAAPDAPSPPSGTTFEGPRGPVRAQRMPDEWRLSAPGENAALSVAGDAAVGAEWASALVVLASFDLTPWRVGA